LRTNPPTPSASKPFPSRTLRAGSVQRCADENWMNDPVQPCATVKTATATEEGPVRCPRPAGGRQAARRAGGGRTPPPVAHAPPRVRGPLRPPGDAGPAGRGVDPAAIDVQATELSDLPHAPDAVAVVYAAVSDRVLAEILLDPLAPSGGEVVVAVDRVGPDP